MYTKTKSGPAIRRAPRSPDGHWDFGGEREPLMHRIRASGVSALRDLREHENPL